MKDDNDLVNFLHHHQPIEPSSPIDLEDRLMRSIESAERNRRRRLYLGTGIIAIISAIGGIFIYKSIESPQLSIAEIHHVETYLEDRWEAIVNVDRPSQHTEEIADIDLLPEMNLDREDM